MTAALLLILAGLAAGYAALCVWRPAGRCWHPRCRRGYLRYRAEQRGWYYTRFHFRCHGSGERTRLGRRVYDRIARGRKAGTR